MIGPPSRQKSDVRSERSGRSGVAKSDFKSEIKSDTNQNSDHSGEVQE